MCIIMHMITLRLRHMITLRLSVPGRQKPKFFELYESIAQYRKRDASVFHPEYGNLLVYRFDVFVKETELTMLMLTVSNEDFERYFTVL